MINAYTAKCVTEVRPHNSEATERSKRGATMQAQMKKNCNVALTGQKKNSKKGKTLISLPPSQPSERGRNYAITRRTSLNI